MSDFRRFVDDYYAKFVTALESFDREPLEEVLRVFERIAERGGTLWVAGNGGSASISDHTACDTSKGTYVDGQPPIRSISLSANNALITALGNDIGYDEIFRHQLRYYLQPDDALLVVSSSGSSPNVVAACRYAKERGVPTIAFVGFQGGILSELADHVVWIQADNYGISEDAHQSLVHVLTQYLCAQAERRAAAG